MTSVAKRLAMHRFEVGRALRTAHHLSHGDLADTQQAIRDLARTMAALAQALDDLLEQQQQELSATV